MLRATNIGGQIDNLLEGTLGGVDLAPSSHIKTEPQALISYRGEIVAGFGAAVSPAAVAATVDVTAANTAALEKAR